MTTQAKLRLFRALQDEAKERLKNYSIGVQRSRLSEYLAPTSIVVEAGSDAGELAFVDKIARATRGLGLSTSQKEKAMTAKPPVSQRTPLYIWSRYYHQVNKEAMELFIEWQASPGDDKLSKRLGVLSHLREVCGYLVYRYGGPYV